MTKKNREETLPKMLPGSVHAQMVRCSREGCQCANGQLHGPYYYRYWREGGKLRKVYIRHSDVDTVKSQCDAWRQQRKRAQAQKLKLEKQGRQDYRRIRALVRELERCGGNTEKWLKLRMEKLTNSAR